MKFGIFDQGDDSGVPAVIHLENRLRIIEAMDRVGFYAYHLAEHHASPLSLMPAQSVFLGAASQRTRRLRLGSMIYLAALHQPVRLIEEICMLDQLTNGRFLLGVGRGGSPAEIGYFNISSDPQEYGDRYNEVLDIVLRGLTSPVLDFEGRFYQIRDMPMLTQTVQRPHPPLWVGLQNLASIPWAVERQINVMATFGPAKEVRRITDTYRTEWAARGNDHAAIPFLGTTRYIVVAETDKEAMRLASEAYPASRRSNEWLWKRQGYSNNLALVQKLFPDKFEDLQRLGHGFAGSPASVRQFVKEQSEEAGLNYFMTQMLFGTLPVEDAIRSVELFGKEVIPAFADSCP